MSLPLLVSPLVPIVKGQGLSLVKHKPLSFSLTMCPNGKKGRLQRQFIPKWKRRRIMDSCVIYARFSSHGQNEQSIEAQIRICKEFAQSKGLKSINIYSDKARTGTNDARPGFQRMIKDAQSGAFKYIIVYMFDRFARNRRDSIMYKEMLKEKYGVRVLSALEPIAEDEGGEFYEMFLDWNAEKYSKRLSKRVKDGLDTSVANGTYCGGTLIYGYRIENEPIVGKPNKFIKRVVICEEEAFILKYVFEQYAKGTMKKQIAEDLNAMGYRFKGKPFTGKTFDRYLTNQKYTGEFEFGGRPCNNMYPPIITKELFNAVQEKLSKNRYFLGGVATAREPYLLTGKLFCGKCNSELIADGGTSETGRQYNYYMCKGRRKKQCDKKREGKNVIEQAVTQAVVDFLSDAENLDKALDDVLKYYNTRTDEKNLKSIQTKIANIEKEIEEQSSAFIKAKSELLRNAIEKKMDEYEILLNDLKYQEAQLELERGYKLSREDLSEFIKEFLDGDVTDKEYQRKVIDYLVWQVFVTDDITSVFFNIKPTKKELDIIDIDDFEEDLSYYKKVQTLSPPSRQEQLV